MSSLRYHAGSTMLLFGAFAIGAVLHGVFVQGEFALTSPVAVFGIAAGLVLIAAGRRLEQRNQESILPVPPDTDDADADEDEAGFDEEAAPFDAAALEKYERDESR